MSEEVKAAETKTEEKLLPQSQVDAIVQDRLAREKAKYADYDDLRKKVSEYERSQDEKQLKILEEQKKYEEALKIHTTKLSELQGLVTQKDSAIASMKIDSALDMEINKQNAYAEETKALLKQQAVFDKEGNIRLKGRDVNGLEILDSIEEGVKKFLTQRPHLVKATQRSGGGTSTAQAGTPGVEVDRATLSQELLLAHQRGDYKKVAELKEKVKGNMTSHKA